MSAHKFASSFEIERQIRKAMRDRIQNLAIRVKNDLETKVQTIEVKGRAKNMQDKVQVSKLLKTSFAESKIENLITN